MTKVEKLLQLTTINEKYDLYNEIKKEIGKFLLQKEFSNVGWLDAKIRGLLQKDSQDKKVQDKALRENIILMLKVKGVLEKIK